ncbi:hypothetical protein BV898_03611 [Hypsibius exemplaris]|uniref:Uncharacterized protein n=1 Tax=Hypsibius exemplaris TaxID=2072580 RepID=A0A1W0X4Z8_HYPEX|nr:hypothetical protein BV898_03611 [Hypsibius exemplaris]
MGHLTFRALEWAIGWQGALCRRLIENCTIYNSRVSRTEYIAMAKSAPSSMTNSLYSVNGDLNHDYASRRSSASDWAREELKQQRPSRQAHPRARFKLYSRPFLLRPMPRLSMNSLVNVYLPAVGALSYEALSVHLVHKGAFSRFFGDRDLSVVNSLLYTSHIGIGLYIYNSPPVCFAASYNRLMYSVFGSVIFNFGSLLLWSTLRNNLSAFHPAARIFLALSTASTMLFVGADYIHFLCAWLRGKP